MGKVLKGVGNAIGSVVKPVAQAVGLKQSDEEAARNAAAADQEAGVNRWNNQQLQDAYGAGMGRPTLGLDNQEQMLNQQQGQIQGAANNLQQYGAGLANSGSANNLQNIAGNQYLAMSQGQGPSLATNLLQSASDQNMRQALSLGLANQNGQAAGVTQRNALNAGQEAALQTQQQVGAIRAQEQQAAMQGLANQGNTLGQQTLQGQQLGLQGAAAGLTAQQDSAQQLLANYGLLNNGKLGEAQAYQNMLGLVTGKGGNTAQQIQNQATQTDRGNTAGLVGSIGGALLAGPKGAAVGSKLGGK